MIDPVTRLEGHGKIAIFLNDDGEVANTYFQVPELRGFEQFCVGRPVEEMPRITTRICGVCPEAHHMASVKACDAVFNVEPPPAAKKLRELLYIGLLCGRSHSALLRPGRAGFRGRSRRAPGRAKYPGRGEESGAGSRPKGDRAAQGAQRVVSIIGGKAIHPVTGIPGGVAKPITAEERDEIVGHSDYFLEFAKFTHQSF